MLHCTPQCDDVELMVMLTQHMSTTAKVDWHAHHFPGNQDLGVQQVLVGAAIHSDDCIGALLVWAPKHDTPDVKALQPMAHESVAQPAVQCLERPLRQLFDEELTGWALVPAPHTEARAVL